MTHLVPVLRPVLGTPFRRGSLYRAAGEVPSFHIAPARTQNARDLITGSVLGTYNSASPAWAVGPDGVLALPAANAPVLEYDPVTGACLGARIWGAVTNLWLYTSAIGTAPWSPIRSTSTLNAAISPDGTLTATRLTEDTSAGTTHLVRQDPLVSGGTTYCWSVFAKASTRSELIMAFGTDNGAFSGEYATFNLSTGQITASGGTTTARINAFPNGWYRCSVTGTALVSTSAVLRHHIALNGSTTYTGDGTSSILLWGAQLQTGSTVGPYVPTTTTAASSTADVWTITGADFSGIINQAEGTIYIQYGPHDATTPATNNSLFTITDSTTSFANIIESFAGSNVAPVLRVQSNGVNQAYISSANYSPSAIHKLAAAYKVDDFARSIDTQSIGTDTSGALPAIAPSILEIGTRSSGGVKPLNGYIREFAVLRSRRPNVNLQAMTQ